MAQVVKDWSQPYLNLHLDIQGPGYGFWLGVGEGSTTLVGGATAGGRWHVRAQDRGVERGDGVGD